MIKTLPDPDTINRCPLMPTTTIIEKDIAIIGGGHRRSLAA
jgi:hypothetical protein